MELRPPAT